MSDPKDTKRIAVVGAGIAGAACAASLQQAGVQVTLFDKSRGVGGRMSTRRAAWAGEGGNECTVEFDHGAQAITARQPRFRVLLARAEAAGMSAAEFAAENDPYTFFRKLGDLIVTGPTNTNVMDVRIVAVREEVE